MLEAPGAAIVMNTNGTCVEGSYHRLTEGNIVKLMNKLGDVVWAWSRKSTNCPVGKFYHVASKRNAIEMNKFSLGVFE